MKLLRTNLIARFYLFFRDDTRLPSDFCTFFWGIVWRVLVTLAALAFCLTVLVGVALLVGALAVTSYRHKLIAVPIYAAVTALVYLCIRYRSSINDKASDALYVAEVAVDSIKSNYCPRIDWQD